MGTPEQPVAASPRDPASSTVSLGFGAAFDRLAGPDGTITVPAQLVELLDSLKLQPTGSAQSELQSLIDSVAGPDAQILNKDAALAVLGLLQSSALAAGASTLSIGAPFKSLSKNRSYIITGHLANDETVISYLAKLEEHRRKCEAEGRYQEAQAASIRLQDLKTAQVAKLRQDLIVNQSKELEEVRLVFEGEAGNFAAMWDNRVAEYETNFRQAVGSCKAAHDQQRQQYVETLLNKRPTKPKPSREYLQQRNMEVNLAKNKQYLQAVKVKEAADELYLAELEQTQATFETEQKLKVSKFTSKQQQEFGSLLQRAARGRDELELRRISESERRMFRYRNVVAELENLHNLEMVQLESFLDAQVAAGKAVPLKDEGVFRRKREAIYAATF
mmetsp:Transcript_11125/g.19420  ORF Transcript_11125/g.19420 Transcript_11125/m.19420 type:complete len:389 (-) Transcript_11125:875-2041(-)